MVEDVADGTCGHMIGEQESCESAALGYALQRKGVIWAAYGL